MKHDIDMAELARAYGAGVRSRVAGMPAPHRIRRRIVLVDDEPASAARLDVLLRAKGLPVELVPEADVEAALVAPEASTGVVVAAVDPLAFIRGLRRNEQLGFVHIVYAKAGCRLRDVGRAFDAGVDDLVRKPWRADEMVERLAGRFDAIAEAGMLHAQALAAGERRGGGTSPKNLQIDETPSFRDAASVMEKMLRDFIGQPIEVRRGRALEAVVGAVVKLVDVERQLEVGAAVGADGPNGAALCRAFMGEGMDDPSLFADVVREVANMVMATLKSSFMADGFALASGVPVERNPEAIEEDMHRYEARKVLVVTGPSFQFSIALGLRRCPPQDQPVEAVEEGMVLAQDLRAPGGGWAARQGTRVTRGLAERMRSWLPGQTVKVADLRTRAA